jgi:ParB-like nuclease domain
MARKSNIDESPEDKFKRDMMAPLDLLLDSKNPRLFGTPAYDTKSQDLLLQTMWSFGVVEIVESISSTGYQSVEPLFVESRQDGKYVVIEGNRRLTALQLLLDPERALKLKITGIPPIKTNLRKTCLSIPVAIGRREDVWTFIATKHLNGPKTWDSLAKAGYVKYVHEELQQPLSKIKESIGDRNGTSIRMYESLKILELAEKWKVFDRDDHAHRSGELPFSHLYTLIGYDSTRRYLGLKGDMTSVPIIPITNKHKLGELLEWVFGSNRKSKAPLVKSQNPDLRYLANALANAKGVEALQAGYAPMVAAEIAEGDDMIVIRHLRSARDELQNTQRKFSTGYKKGHVEIGVAFEEVRDAWRGLAAQKTVIDSED